jgi:hypothetical protein
VISNDINVSTCGKYDVLGSGNNWWVSHSLIAYEYNITWNTTFSISNSTPTVLHTSVEQYDSSSNTTITVFTNISALSSPNNTLINITILQNLHGEILLYFGSQSNELSGPSVVVSAITNTYLQIVQVLSDTAVTTIVLALSGSCALATSTLVKNQIIPPPGSSRAFIVSFTFDLKVLSNKYNLFIYVYLIEFLTL